MFFFLNTVYNLFVYIFQNSFKCYVIVVTARVWYIFLSILLTLENCNFRSLKSPWILSFQFAMNPAADKKSSSKLLLTVQQALLHTVDEWHCGQRIMEIIKSPSKCIKLTFNVDRTPGKYSLRFIWISRGFHTAVFTSAHWFEVLTMRISDCQKHISVFLQCIDLLCSRAL